MPNHFHGIVVIGDIYNLPNIDGFPDTNAPEAMFRSPTKTVGAMLRGFKASVTSQIQKKEDVVDLKLWQRNYYEHIIRDEPELERIREYIKQNPSKWQEDKEFFKKLLKKMTKR